MALPGSDTMDSQSALAPRLDEYLSGDSTLTPVTLAVVSI
jgi:hypothetical protein